MDSNGIFEGICPGSLMRLAPVPMYFAGDPVEAIDRSADSSRTTHGAEEAIDACRYFAGLLLGALHGVDKETLLSAAYCPVDGLWERSPLAAKIAAIADGSFKHRDPPDIRGTGYVIDSLEAALWAFHRSRDFREGALLAVNLGDDADTTGAIYGQIAGAHYGVEAKPTEWRQPDDDGRDHVNGRRPLRPRAPVHDTVGFRYSRKRVRNPPLRIDLVRPIRIDLNHPVT